MNRDADFVLHRAAALLVLAYKERVQEYQKRMPLALAVDSNTLFPAPTTYEGLTFNAEQGDLVVSDDNHCNPIYGKAGNIQFRVFHDYGHLIHGYDFSLGGELALAEVQWQEIVLYIPLEWVDICRVLYFADTAETVRFQALTGNFPLDQTAFIKPFLAAHLKG